MRRRAFIKRASGLLVPAIFPTVVRGQFAQPRDLAFWSSAAVNNGAATGWVGRVIANGGASPSQATINAVNTFDAALVTAGTKSLIKYLNFYAPDSLIAAQTPYIVGSGLDPMTNQCGGGTGTMDITVNGLARGTATAGNFGSKPSVDFADDLSAGITLYVFTTVNEAVVDLGYANDALTQAFEMVTNSGGVFVGNIYSQVTGAYVATLPGGSFTGAGYFSLNRVSATEMRLYIANGGTAHAQLGTTIVTEAGTRQNQQCYLWSANQTDHAGACSADSQKRYSCLMLHLGLTSTQSNANFNAIQALRTSFGGGFI